jgi:hypothetical protein
MVDYFSLFWGLVIDAWILVIDESQSGELLDDI